MALNKLYIVNALTVVLVIVALVYNKIITQRIMSDAIDKIKETKNIVVEKTSSWTNYWFPQTVWGADLRQKIYDRLSGPTKFYSPQNIRPPGPGQYQVMGYVYRSEDDVNYNKDDINRLTLYGRRDYQNTNKFEYYVAKDDGIKIPISDTAELYDGDTVTVTGMTGDFKAVIYENEQIVY